MGFLTPPKPPPPPPPPASADVSRVESKKIAKRKRARGMRTSSYASSMRAGAVNPNYSTGSKTAQGQ
jgi:hypothetical protein